MQASFYPGIIPKWSIAEDSQKRKEKKKWKKKKKRGSTRAGRVEERCTIGGRNKTRLCDDKINKKSRLSVKFYGQYTYENVTACTILVNCTIPSLTHRHPTFGFAFLASLTVFHLSTDIKLWSESVRACLSRLLRGKSSNLENKMRRKQRQLLMLFVLSYRQQDHKSPDTFNSACAF